MVHNASRALVISQHGRHRIQDTLGVKKTELTHDHVEILTLHLAAQQADESFSRSMPEQLSEASAITCCKQLPSLHGLVAPAVRSGRLCPSVILTLMQ